MDLRNFLSLLILTIVISISLSHAEDVPTFSDSDLGRYKSNSTKQSNDINYDWPGTMQQCRSLQNVEEYELSHLLNTVDYILKNQKNAPAAIKKCRSDIETEINKINAKREYERWQKEHQSKPPASASAPTYTPSEETRKELEKDEIHRRRDAYQPVLREFCRQGNQESCREYEKWESIR